MRHRRVERNPAPLVADFERDVTEEPRLLRVGTGEHQPDRMPNRLEHRAQQDRHVVTVSSLELEHAAGSVQHFDPERILGVSYAALNPLEQRLDLSAVVLGTDPAGQQDVDRPLPHVKIFSALTNQAFHLFRGLHGPGVAPGDRAQRDPRCRCRNCRIAGHARILASDRADSAG